MTRLTRLFIVHSFVGFVAATGFVAMLIAFNVVNLRYLVTHVDGGPFALGVLWMCFGLLFGGVQIGYAVMRMAARGH